MKHFDLKFLACRYNNGRHARCVHCEEFAKNRVAQNKPIKTVNTKKVTTNPLDKEHTEKRREYEFLSDLKELNKQYSYNLDDLI
jgi:hypothetical protein